LGLGPGAPEHLTLQAQSTLASASEIWLRTRHHPVVAHLPPSLAVHSFDALYEGSESFDEVYAAIAARVVDLGQRPEGVLYAVPGHPWVAERSVALIHRHAAEAGREVRVIPGLSFLEPSLSALQLDPLDSTGFQLVDATVVARRHHPPLDPDRPALVAQVYSRQVASDVKLTLLAVYPAEHAVAVVDAAGTPRERVERLPLAELDHRGDWGLLTSLLVPPLPVPGSLLHFQEIVARLRAPDGCPWDREQTHQSLRAGLLEECAEVLDALDADDVGALREELGDLLLHVLMQAQIAAEEGEFTLNEVIAEVSAKLIRRHPHVFGEVEVAGMDELLRNWEAIKRDEKQARGSEPGGPLEGVPLALPALARAQKIVKRAGKAGWPAPRAGAAWDAWRAAPDERSLGTLLLALASEAQAAGIEAEQALRGAVREVEGRGSGGA
ncbi:MAG TPA: MazG family protein, partial [Ardenticatenaceae bacterium]|nr:MazG family protein [Ardenticatenaceae bacterium]